MYPYRNDDAQAAIERMPSTHFGQDDKPEQHTQRYSLSPDYEDKDLDDKSRLNSQGAADNLYWYNKNIKQRLGMEA